MPRIRSLGLGELTATAALGLAQTYFVGKFEVMLGEIDLEPREAMRILSSGSPVQLDGSELIARARITVNNNHSFGLEMTVQDSDFRDVDPRKRHPYGKAVPVVIEGDGWIAASSTILKVVRVGRSAVIAEESAVGRDVPTLTIGLANRDQEVRKIFGAFHAG